MIESKIFIVDNKFEIIRYEGFGYVKNICNYDKNIFKLEISYQPSRLEGGNCKTIYSFEIITPTNTKSSYESTIEFITDYSENKYYTYYSYNSNLEYVIKFDKSDKNEINKSNTKCIIF